MNEKLHEDMLPIRWLIRRDLPEVMEIENASFDEPWTLDDFLSVMRQRPCIGMVVEYQRKIVGFVVYELGKGTFRVLNIAVHPEYRRRGIGTRMIARLKDKLSGHNRHTIGATTRERNLRAQKFFRALEFRAVQVVYGMYDSTDEDAYELAYELPEIQKPWNPLNRIGKFFDGE